MNPEETDADETEDKPGIYDENDPEDRADRAESAERFVHESYGWNGPSD